MFKRRKKVKCKKPFEILCEGLGTEWSAFAIENEYKKFADKLTIDRLDFKVGDYEIVNGIKWVIEDIDISKKDEGIITYNFIKYDKEK